MARGKSPGCDPRGESFCIYCQHEYRTVNRLRTHVLSKHADTIRAAAYRDAERLGLSG